MILVICNVAAVLVYVGLGIVCGIKAIRTQRELAALRTEKAARMEQKASERHSAGLPEVPDDFRADLLYLLHPHEKPNLLNMDSPLPNWLAKWLGGKRISELQAYDAAYYAGYALREKSWLQFKSLMTTTAGGLVITRFFFSSLSQAQGLVAPESENLLLSMVTSMGHWSAAYFPIVVGLGFLAWSWRLKEASDERKFYAKVLEDHARRAYARDHPTDG